MNNTSDSTVFAVQSAVLDLFESIDYVTSEGGFEKQEDLKIQAQRTILMMIAAIVLASRKYESGHWAFLSALVNWQDLPGGEARYLNEYATRWRESSSNQVPDFFAEALRFDLSHQTAITGTMLRQIQLVGNAVCAADGCVTDAEKGIVRSYIEFLEQKVKTAKGEAVADRISREPLTNTLPDSVAETEVQYEKYEAVPPVVYPPVSIPQVISPRRRAELQWVPANQTINIGRFDIPSGMIYVSDGHPSTEEASAINLQLPIGQTTNGNHPLSYYPNYAFIEPSQRATYLEWLASGRKDANPEARELGYVFIFFYGLERRLLVDQAQEQEVVAELVRLLQHYGPYTRSRSLQSYTSQLIHFWGWQQGLDYYCELLEWMKTLPVSLVGDDELSIILASFSQKQKALPSDLVYEVAYRNCESRRSVVVSRVNAEFRSLFSKRYLENYPQGLLLHPSKRTTSLAYRPASPTLLYGRSVFSVRIPDVGSLQSQFRPLAKIWNACVDDLAGYSRAKSKPKSDNASVKLNEYLALPEELKAETAHPLTTHWNEILSVGRQGKGCCLIEVANIGQLLNFSQREKLTPSQSSYLAQAIESLGFEVEPDARYDTAYAWDQELAVYKPSTSAATGPSQNYKGASVLLKLCLLVAGADGNVAPEELEVSRHFIEKNLTLSPEDKLRLEALEQILIADPSMVKGSLARIAAPVPKAQRELICEVLVHVAAADNVVTKDEIRMLERIFKAFELPNDKLDVYLKSVGEFKEITIQTSGSRVPGESIPQPNQPFRINMARVDAIAKETSEVISILSKVMVDDESQDEVPIQTADPKIPAASRAQPTHSVETPEWTHSLDLKYQPILMQLIEHNSWSRAEFNELVKKFNLMPLSAFDAINEWADEKLGDFLLEGEDPIKVHKDIIA